LLAREALRRGVADYCAAQGWKIMRVLREEEGVLPIALAGDIVAFLDAAPPGVAQVGMRAALFHPLTGYSLPDAVALADRIAAAPDLSGPALAGLAREHAVSAWKSRGFYRLLARMLFGAASPSERYKVLQRFYRLPQPLIERFYAGETPIEDQARILLGKPPVPILRAAACVNEAAWLNRARTA
jgi:lycopene beta-cyclase